MKLKMLDILNAKELLTHLYVEKATPKGAFALGKNISALNKELQLFEKERYKLLKQFGEKVEGKPEGYLEVPESKREEFSKKIEVVVLKTVDVNIKPLSFDDLLITLSPAEMSLIEWMFVE